ncbi:hypothetical protein P4N68_03035 [Corynebacterium felinum]|uniref:Secreted protein n=2 Tax=Corynebacterium felinum TaxID=131318 RepID=A0ABU2BBB4_9CORY|nr:hypothetical protein [Corynebacterium felinum]MDF5820058.1 hypothetical protein [Corynebacterium felinum]MDR7355917.1 hypothetical protein [Corynebacterium felinum]
MAAIAIAVTDFLIMGSFRNRFMHKLLFDLICHPSRTCSLVSAYSVIRRHVAVTDGNRFDANAVETTGKQSNVVDIIPTSNQL